MIYLDGAVFAVFSNIKREGHECLVMTSLRVLLLSLCRMSPKTASKLQSFMFTIHKIELQETLKGILNTTNICLNWRFVNNKCFKAILLTGFLLFDCCVVTLENRGTILLFLSSSVYLAVWKVATTFSQPSQVFFFQYLAGHANIQSGFWSIDQDIKDGQIAQVRIRKKEVPSIKIVLYSKAPKEGKFLQCNENK